MEDGKFTMFAGKAVALAEVFKFSLGKEAFVGSTICRLELSAPTEQSTDGGRLAVQHVSIVPENGGPATVVLTVYQVDRRAEARQYEVVAEMYKKRFHSKAFPVSPGQFDEMTRRLKEFFLQFGFTFALAPLTCGGPNASTTPPSRHPTAGAVPVHKRPTGAGSVAIGGNVADRQAPRAWVILAGMAFAALAISVIVVYLLGQ